jgi:hypothetical protein
MNYPNLSSWQSIKRRFCLFSYGSYRHPDGLIEGDFHDKAGIHIYLDEQSVQDEKLKQYYQVKNKSEQFWKPFTYGAIVMAIFTELIKRFN